MSNQKVVGIDIGGSHITAAVVDLEKRSVLRETLVRNRVDSHAPATDVISQWSSSIAEVLQGSGGVSKKLGIAMPGPFDYEQGISLIIGLDKYEKLYGLNVREMLAEKLGIDATGIRMMNDASCFLQGELFGGAVAGANHVVGVTLGTGLGSATFHDGVLYDGDLYCSNFKEGTAEDYLSSRWFVKRYAEDSVRSARDVKELVERLPEEPLVQNLFDEFGNNLGEVLANYSNQHACTTVVIGGNITHAWHLFFAQAKKVLDSLAGNVHIQKAQLGELAALTGAASLWQ